MKKVSRPGAEIQITSTYDNIPVAVEFVEMELRKAGLNEDDVENYCIVVSEAIANAVIHGNGLDETKKVSISIIRGKNVVCISVCDHGSGFNLKKVNNPLDPENKGKFHGRGIHIMKTMSDRVSYAFKGTGTQISIFKRLS